MALSIIEINDESLYTFRAAEYILSKYRCLNQIEKWRKIVILHIRLYSKVISNADLSHKQSFLLQGVRSNQVKWVDVSSIFQRRIGTGIIITLKHKDFNEFFTDAFLLNKKHSENIVTVLSLYMLVWGL